jgi:hypothetical protein
MRFIAPGAGAINAARPPAMVCANSSDIISPIWERSPRGVGPGSNSSGSASSPPIPGGVTDHHDWPAFVAPTTSES